MTRIGDDSDRWRLEQADESGRRAPPAAPPKLGPAPPQAGRTHQRPRRSSGVLPSAGRRTGKSPVLTARARGAGGAARARARGRAPQSQLRVLTDTARMVYDSNWSIAAFAPFGPGEPRARAAPSKRLSRRNRGGLRRRRPPGPASGPPPPAPRARPESPSASGVASPPFRSLMRALADTCRRERPLLSGFVGVFRGCVGYTEHSPTPRPPPGLIQALRLRFDPGPQGPDITQAIACTRANARVGYAGPHTPRRRPRPP